MTAGDDLKVVLLPLELGRGVDLAGAHLLDRHLYVVHPLYHLGNVCYFVFNIQLGPFDIYSDHITYI